MLHDLTTLSTDQATTLGMLLALAIALLALLRVVIGAIRQAQAANALALAETAESLIRAHNLDARPKQPDVYNAHLVRLARLRAASRSTTPPDRPATRNPGPGLRPHPVHGYRSAAPAPAYVIPPAVETLTPASISTDDTPDQLDAAVIHSMTLPIGGGEQAGEFSGAGASSSWSSDTSSSTNSSTSTSGD